MKYMPSRGAQSRINKRFTLIVRHLCASWCASQHVMKQRLSASAQDRCLDASIKGNSEGHIARFPEVALIALKVWIIFAEISNDQRTSGKMRLDKLENRDVLIVAAVKDKHVNLPGEILEGFERIPRPNLNKVIELGVFQVLGGPTRLLGQDLCGDEGAFPEIAKGSSKIDR